MEGKPLVPYINSERSSFISFLLLETIVFTASRIEMESYV